MTRAGRDPTTPPLPGRRPPGSHTPRRGGPSAPRRSRSRAAWRRGGAARSELLPAPRQRPTPEPPPCGWRAAHPPHPPDPPPAAPTSAARPPRPANDSALRQPRRPRSGAPARPSSRLRTTPQLRAAGARRHRPRASPTHAAAPCGEHHAPVRLGSARRRPALRLPAGSGCRPAAGPAGLRPAPATCAAPIGSNPSPQALSMAALPRGSTRGSATRTSKPEVAASTPTANPTGPAPATTMSASMGSHPGQPAGAAIVPTMLPVARRPSAASSQRMRTASSGAFSSVNVAAVSQAVCTSGSARPSNTTAR